MAGSGLGRLGLWWHLRQGRDNAQALPRIPQGAGPVLLMHVAPTPDRRKRRSGAG